MGFEPATLWSRFQISKNPGTNHNCLPGMWQALSDAQPTMASWLSYAQVFSFDLNKKTALKTAVVVKDVLVALQMTQPLIHSQY